MLTTQNGSVKDIVAADPPSQTTEPLGRAMPTRCATRLQQTANESSNDSLKGQESKEEGRVIPVCDLRDKPILHEDASRVLQICP